MTDRQEIAGGCFEAPFRLAGARSHVLEAQAVRGCYRLDLAVPDGAPPADGWPAVLLLDANGAFATCAEAARRMGRRPDATGAVPLVVIGVSAMETDGAPAQRRRDFTTPVAGHAESGGAAVFLRFLDGEVLPLVARYVPLDRARCTLFGHSLAGYFALFALSARPQLFRGYAAISPSIWWDRETLFAGLARLSASDRRVMLLMGAWEDRLPPWQLAHPGVDEVRARRAGRRLLGNVRDAAALLRRVLGQEQVHFRLLDDEDHASIVSAAVPRLLRLASGHAPMADAQAMKF